MLRSDIRGSTVLFEFCHVIYFGCVIKQYSFKKLLTDLLKFYTFVSQCSWKFSFCLRNSRIVYDLRKYVISCRNTRGCPTTASFPQSAQTQRRQTVHTVLGEWNQYFPARYFDLHFQSTLNVYKNCCIICIVYFFTSYVLK